MGWPQPRHLARPLDADSNTWGTLEVYRWLGGPADRAAAICDVQRKLPRYLTLTPRSAKYFAAPGCQGTAVAPIVWFSTVMLAASRCAMTMSLCRSNSVFTMS